MDENYAGECERANARCVRERRRERDKGPLERHGGGEGGSEAIARTVRCVTRDARFSVINGCRVNVNRDDSRRRRRRSPGVLARRARNAARPLTFTDCQSALGNQRRRESSVLRGQEKGTDGDADRVRLPLTTDGKSDEGSVHMVRRPCLFVRVSRRSCVPSFLPRRKNECMKENTSCNFAEARKGAWSILWYTLTRF